MAAAAAAAEPNLIDVEMNDVFSVNIFNVILIGDRICRSVRAILCIYNSVLEFYTLIWSLARDFVNAKCGLWSPAIATET